MNFKKFMLDYLKGVGLVLQLTPDESRYFILHSKLTVVFHDILRIIILYESHKGIKEAIKLIMGYDGSVIYEK